MSKHHNYSKYANKNNVIDEEAVVEVEQSVGEPETAVEPEATAIENVDTAPTEVPPIPVVGTVVNCAKLNVRAKPIAGAAVLCVLDANTKIEVDVEKSTEEWVSVCTATGVDGYCMRNFVNVDL